MATLDIAVNDAALRPLDDTVDLDVRAVQTGALVFQARGASGKKRVRLENLVAGQPYKIRALPMRHRPVQQFASVLNGKESGTVAVYCPVDPARVLAPAFPAYNALEGALRLVLEASSLEQEQRSPSAPASTGETLFNALDNLQKAGLLNLFAKMRHTLMGGATTWDFVTDVYRVRGDRIFANVTVDFRDRVKNEVAGGMFHEVPQSLHQPPPDFRAAGSFKTADHYGNLQLTFFSSATAPLEFKLDADCDDAAGIEHGFQVIGHSLTGGETHPYDIHEILTFYQRLDVGYELPV